MWNGLFGAIGTLVLVVLLTACGTMTDAAGSPSLDGTAWVLAGVPGRALVPGTSVTLQFAEGHLAGSDGCNRYMGGYTAKGPALEVASQLSSTQMACPAEVMEQARVYLAALTGTKSYRVADSRLELRSADGATLATLAAVSQALAGTSWRATGINNGKQAVASLVTGSAVTMAFGADGIASGSAGCNRYSAPYTAGGSKLTFGQAAVTRKMCARPDGVMEQEQQFLKALSTVATSRIDGDDLELRTAVGALAVALAREPPR